MGARLEHKGHEGGRRAWFHQGVHQHSNDDKENVDHNRITFVVRHPEKEVGDHHGTHA